MCNKAVVRTGDNKNKSLLQSPSISFRWTFPSYFPSQPEEKEDDLDAADDREPRKETHGASNETELGVELDLFLFLNVVEGRRVKVDLHQL